MCANAVELQGIVQMSLHFFPESYYSRRCEFANDQIPVLKDSCKCHILRTENVGTCHAEDMVVMVTWQTGFKNLLPVHHGIENEGKSTASRCYFYISSLLLIMQLRISDCAHMTRSGWF